MVSMEPKPDLNAASAAEWIKEGETWGEYRDRRLAELSLEIGRTWNNIEAAFPKPLRWIVRIIHRWSL